MQITLEQYNQVQQYLDGEMTDEQRKEFLLELSSNRELSESYEFEKYIRQNARSIRQAGEIIEYSREEHELSGDPVRTAAIRNIIETAGQQWKDGVEEIPAMVIPIRRRRRLSVAVAASLIFIAGSITVVLSLRHGGSKITAAVNEALFARYFTKDNLPQESYPMLAQAFTDYSNNKYTTLQEYDLENLPTLKGAAYSKEKILELGYYYKGISYLATGEAEKATVPLQWVIDHAVTDSLVWKAEWYKALALIRTSHVPGAIVLLHTLSSNPRAEGYKQQAGDLLQKLQEHEN